MERSLGRHGAASRLESLRVARCRWSRRGLDGRAERADARRNRLRVVSERVDPAPIEQLPDGEHLQPWVLAQRRHHRPMGAIRRKSFEDRDGLRELPLLTVSLARIGSDTIGRGVVQPGWHWSEHLAPVMRTESCPVHHVQVLLSGRFAVRMDDGEEVAFQPGDVMDIPPGHDAWVVGDDPAVLIDFAGNIDALGLPREHERMVTTLLMTDIVDSPCETSYGGDACVSQCWPTIWDCSPTHVHLSTVRETAR